VEFQDVVTRRRLLALGAVAFGILSGGDDADRAPMVEPAPVAARRRVAVRRVGTSSAPPLPPLPRRKTAIHGLHELRPNSPINAIALTIDDGPHPEWTPKMLDLLAEHQVKATFSLIGQEVKRFPKLARRIAASGHELCNHTMHHPMGIGQMSSRHVDAEITEAHDRISQATGVAPRYFRAPGGNWSRAVFGSVARHGMLPIDWDVDPRDWARPGTSHIEHTMLTAKGGDIILCHDGGGDRSETIKALRHVIPGLKKRGLTFVML
jgi:peptidoglycan/xylan/chitin deacetylase (PgdA/CDA1 family)